MQRTNEPHSSWLEENVSGNTVSRLAARKFLYNTEWHETNEPTLHVRVIEPNCQRARVCIRACVWSSFLTITIIVPRIYVAVLLRREKLCQLGGICAASTVAIVSYRFECNKNNSVDGEDELCGEMGMTLTESGRRYVDNWQQIDVPVPPP